MNEHIDILKLAYEIIDMQALIKTQRAEILRLQEYEEKYTELLNSSLKDASRLTDYIIQNIVNSKKKSDL